MRVRPHKLWHVQIGLVAAAAERPTLQAFTVWHSRSVPDRRATRHRCKGPEMSLHRKLAWVLMAPWALLAVGNEAVAQSADHAQAQPEVRPLRDVRLSSFTCPGPNDSQARITQFAAEDPAVRSGLLVAEVRPWLIGMRP